MKHVAVVMGLTDGWDLVRQRSGKGLPRNGGTLQPITSLGLPSKNLFLHVSTSPSGELLSRPVDTDTAEPPDLFPVLSSAGQQHQSSW